MIVSKQRWYEIHRTPKSHVVEPICRHASSSEKHVVVLNVRRQVEGHGLEARVDKHLHLEAREITLRLLTQSQGHGCCQVSPSTVPCGSKESVEVRGQTGYRQGDSQQETDLHQYMGSGAYGRLDTNTVVPPMRGHP